MKINIEKINILMAKKALPAYKLADLAGVSRQTISTVRYRGTCSTTTAIKIANGLGVEIEELI